MTRKNRPTGKSNNNPKQQAADTAAHASKSKQPVNIHDWQSHDLSDIWPDDEETGAREAQKPAAVREDLAKAGDHRNQDIFKDDNTDEDHSEEQSYDETADVHQLGEESHSTRRESFTEALHKAWATTNLKAEDAGGAELFGPQLPPNLEDRLNHLREKTAATAPTEPRSQHVADAVASRRETAGSQRRLDGQSSRNIDGHRPGAPQGAYSEEGLQDIVNKLKPDVLSTPDAQPYPPQPPKSSFTLTGAGFILSALLGVGLSTLVFYYTIGAPDDAGWTTPSAELSTTRAIVPAPPVKPVAEPKPVIASQERFKQPPPPPPPLANHTPPPSPPPVVKAEASFQKSQARIIVADQAAPATTVQKAVTPDRPTALRPEERSDQRPVAQNAIPETSTDAVSAAPKVAKKSKPKFIIEPAAAIPERKPPVSTPLAPRQDQPLVVQPTQPQQVARLEQNPPAPASRSIARPPANFQARRTPDTTADTSAIMQQAGQHLESGDISAARLLYEHAAQIGNILAAVKLAETYDPLTIEQFEVYGVKPDVQLARKWYQSAAQVGNQQAQQRLEALNSWFARVDQFKN